MRYAKGPLMQKLRDQKALHEQRLREAELKEQREFEKAWQRWVQVDKPKLLAVIDDFRARVEADDPEASTYRLYNKHSGLSAPARPKTVSDATCTPAIRRIDQVLEVLELIQDEEVSSYALEKAGIAKLSEVLRSPC